MKILAAAGILLCSAAHAEVAGNASTRQTQTIGRTTTERTFDFQGDADWFRVQLTLGRDVYVSVFCLGCTFDIRNYSGRVLAVGHSNDDGGAEGFEFRAPYKGLYFLEVKDVSSPQVYTWPQTYQTIVVGDCRGDARTQCVRNPGGTLSGALIDGADADSYWTSLKAGQPYTVTLSQPVESSATDLAIYDPDGQIVWFGGTTTFTPAKSGNYRLQVSSENTHGGGTFTLSVN